MSEDAPERPPRWAEWPPQFDQWPRDAQVRYLAFRYQRAELISAIGELADISSIQQREPDPSNARLSKDELAGVALELGIYRRFLDHGGDQWFEAD